MQYKYEDKVLVKKGFYQGLEVQLLKQIRGGYLVLIPYKERGVFIRNEELK